MFKQISKLLKLSTVVAVLLVSGCGGGSPSASDGSIIMSPASITWAITAGACGGPFSYQQVVITVLGANGAPVPDAGMKVTLDLSNGTFSGGSPLTLYDDPTWVSGSSTAPTNAVGGSYSTKTGSSGSKTLIVGVDLGCTYKGNLNVYYGALFQSVNIDVSGS